MNGQAGTALHGRSSSTTDRWCTRFPYGHPDRNLGAYSRHLREGMVRVDATSPNPDLLVSAYEGEGHEGAATTRTLIATNRGLEPQTLTVNWPGTTWAEMERVSQYAENQRESVPAKILIQPGEIVTLSTLSLPPAGN